MSKYIDEVFEGLREVTSVSEDLAILAEAHSLLGNEKLGGDFKAMSNELKEAESKICSAVSKELN